VFGMAPKEAIATSLAVVGIGSAGAAVQHWRAGSVRPRTGLVFGAAGMCGAYLGGRAAAFVDGGVLLLLFASMMALTALAMWRGRPPIPAEAPRRPAWGRLVVQGLAVGSFTGLVGAGGGFLIVPALALWAGLPMAEAVGTSLLVIVMQSAAGFGGYASHVAVEPARIGAIAACVVAGSFGGARLSRVVPPGAVRRAFAVFVLAMAAFILTRESALLLRTSAEALPSTLPQLLFALFMLGVGIAAGRGTRPPAHPRPRDEHFREGGGI